MKFRLFPVIFAAAMALCASANASRVYYLVGLRHVYSVPVYPDPHEADRQAIEEAFTVTVADAQKQYDTDMASIHDEEAKDGGNVHQIDRDAVQQNLEAAIADAAEKRDEDLAAMYPRMDDIRVSHPEFKVDQDGPYKVMGVETAPTGEFVEVVYYRPYPSYVEICPFGWSWGRPYAYSSFGIEVGLCHSTWISIGAPVFEPMYYGGVYVFINAPIRRDVIVSRGGWVGGRPPVITASERVVLEQNRVAAVKSHYFESPAAAHAAISSRGRTGIGAGAVSKYSHSALRNAGSGSAATSRTSGTTNGTTGSRFSRTETPSRPGNTGGPGSTSSRYAHPPTTPTSRQGSSSHGGSSKDSSSDKKKGG
jgi:hypothetical protein